MTGIEEAMRCAILLVPCLHHKHEHSHLHNTVTACKRVRCLRREAAGNGNRSHLESGRLLSCPLHEYQNGVALRDSSTLFQAGGNFSLSPLRGSVDDVDVRLSKKMLLAFAPSAGHTIAERLGSINDAALHDWHHAAWPSRSCFQAS